MLWWVNRLIKLSFFFQRNKLSLSLSQCPRSSHIADKADRHSITLSVFQKVADVLGQRVYEDISKFTVTDGSSKG